MNDVESLEIREQARLILGSKSQDQMKKRISEMFETLRNMRVKGHPGSAWFAEELRIWDDVYHELKF